MSCNMAPHGRLPAQTYTQSHESVIKLMIPNRLINQELASLAKDNSIIKKISPLKMDPVTNIISLRMTIKYPLNTLFDYELKPPTKISEEQEIEMAFSLPKPKTLAMTRYLGIEFHKFKINGDDYLNAFSVVASVIQTVLANSSLINYVFDQAGSSIKDYRLMLSEVIESNGIIVNPTLRKISFKLNLKYFDQLADFTRYEQYKNIGLWIFSPYLLEGTQDVFFRLEAGLGKPSAQWFNETQSRMERDQRTLLQVRNELYTEYSNINSIKSILINYLDQILNKENIRYSNLSPIYKNDIDKLKSSFATSASKVLNTNQPTFQADPEDEYISFISEQKERIKNFVSELDRKLTIDANILARGSKLPTRPLVTKRIGQDLINSGMNFVRDIEYDGQYFIKDTYIGLAPQLPGIIARGKIHIDLNYLLGQMDSGLIGKKVTSKISETSTGIPYEIALETRMEDNSVLALDIKSLSLFEGSNKLYFSRNSKNQTFMMDMMKIMLAESLAAIEFDTGGTSSLSSEAKEQLRIKELLSYLEAIKTAYHGTAGNELIKNIINLMNLDIVKNPQVSAGEDYIKNKSKILFGDLIKYDPKDGLFKIKLDPAIMVEKINGASHNLQVWNIAPVYSREFNNTFLEMTVGPGVRGQNYINQIFDQRNNLDNANFVGIYNDNNRSTVDMLASIDFSYLESYLNQLFGEMVKENNGNYEKELEKDEEQTHYIIDQIKLDIQTEKKIVLHLNASVLSKKKGGLFGWGKWKVDKSSYGLSADIDLASKSLASVRSQLNNINTPIFLADQLIAVQLNRAKLKFGKPSLVNDALNRLTNINLTSPLGTKFRGLILKITNMYFQNAWKKQDQNKLYGHSIEEMVRVFTTKDEIMLMLNPRLGGAAFELKLTGEEQNFATRSIKVEPKAQQLHVAFTASTAMAKIDKRELIRLVEETNALFAEYLNAKTKTELENKLKDMQLVSKAVLNSDESKRSLYHRMIHILRNYDQVLNVVNIEHAARNQDRKISACGAELMYFAGSSFILYHRFNQLIQKIDHWQLGQKIPNYKSFVEARNKIGNNVFKPLMKKYQTDFQKRNGQIIASPYSYWTHSFYPDAFFTEALYKELLKESSL
jgi:hypothetical protein